MSFSPTLAPIKNIDENWIQLMIAARSMGVSKEEVLQFIRHLKKQHNRQA